MEFSLVSYTVLLQMAAGMALVAWASRGEEDERTERIFWRTVLVASIVGGLASMFHLHDIFNSPYTLTQITHSWMSWEIISTGLFLFLALLKATGKLRIWGNRLTALTGLILVLSMIQVYTHNQSMPLWQNLGTYISFLATMFLLGGFGGLAMLSTGTGNISSGCPSATGRMLNICRAFIMIAIPFSLIMPAFWIDPITTGALQQESLEGLVRHASSFSLLQAGLVALASLSVVLLKQKRPLLLWVALLLAIVSSLVGRTLFFAAGIKTGF